MNLGSPVKNCLRVSLICLSESVRRGPILSGCDMMKPFVLQTDASGVGVTNVLVAREQRTTYLKVHIQE